MRAAVSTCWLSPGAAPGVSGHVAVACVFPTRRFAVRAWRRRAGNGRVDLWDCGRNVAAVWTSDCQRRDEAVAGAQHEACSHCSLAVPTCRPVRLWWRLRRGVARRCRPVKPDRRSLRRIRAVNPRVREPSAVGEIVLVCFRRYRVHPLLSAGNRCAGRRRRAAGRDGRYASAGSAGAGVAGAQTLAGDAADYRHGIRDPARGRCPRRLHRAQRRRAQGALGRCHLTRATVQPTAAMRCRSALTRRQSANTGISRAMQGLSCS